MSLVVEVREEVLGGGTANAGRISRIGNTVRRPSRPTSATTAELLDHLQRAGFDGAPRYLGIDDQGREVLSYVPGEVIPQPYRHWVADDAALASVARLVRAYHDAVAGFNLGAYTWPHSLPPQFCDGLVCHNDVNPSNVVFDRGEAVALIDFDLASPGCVGWDLACCIRHWIPLEPGDHLEADVQALRRLQLFVDAYGASDRERRRLLDALVPCHDWCSQIVQDAVDAGHAAFRQQWLGGERWRARRKRLWLLEHASQVREALSLGAP